ncbi:lipocalin family protein [Salinimicrobium sp. MT39]|uniref:Lipocalin family protein n=1 Tax=Salinimicrobium profundisediminis TaxID=2994553 RepID=A0A9X3CV40_9FLAO|nr:lipocalin family protein [Salinimicrobium profundisediminis]MCX2837063.1 lipocalin family protein [Salinimicrobium profundisediminis]
MKKIVFLILSVVFLVSCGSSKVANEARATMNGDWQLTSITYPGNSQNVQVSLLNDVPARCLEGSTWNFISNNNTGSYVVSGLNCPSETEFFIWSIDGSNAAMGNYDLMFKPTNSDHKSVTGNTGYRINLTHLSGSQMTWEQTVSFEGKPFTIKMNFNK